MLLKMVWSFLKYYLGKYIFFLSFFLNIGIVVKLYEILSLIDNYFNIYIL